MEMDEEQMRAMLAENEQLSRLRALYHRVTGEVIQYRLAFAADAPDFVVAEDYDTRTVTVTPAGGDDADRLVLDADDFDSADVPGRVREWIRERVDVGWLVTRKRSRYLPGDYWGQAARQSR